MKLRRFYTQMLQQYNTKLNGLFPPSEPCTCEICRNYCRRPGWWTVDEAYEAMKRGLSHRMMLEIAPERTFGVLSPAFKGNEGNYAFQVFAANGCTFFKNNLCELSGSGIQPLECRYCHHSRSGEGIKCHVAIENDWKTVHGQNLVVMWHKQLFNR